jgi:hypothetical protein
LTAFFLFVVILAGNKGECKGYKAESEEFRRAVHEIGVKLFAKITKKESGPDFNQDFCGLFSRA